ncbi:MAG: nicotinate phosphoribosyltransferase [Acidobacteria bacterium]|nr:nicotinate phosphoribosyltransferase [Acidobacteriota bacterium]
MYTNALLTDFYELTMAAGYLERGKASETATFDLYFRHNPFKGGYSIAAGLEPAVRAAVDCRFHSDDIRYLKEQKTPTGAPIFGDRFLDYLASFRFRGNIKAVPEGTAVFPDEPLMQVRGNLIECQILESVLLCHINFQTLVATKAARIWEASNHGAVIEFGLRRAQGPDGALSACRAAYIGGADSTSNVLGAARLGIPARGTHAHSWIQSFDSELEAFRAYANSFPDACILLLDTYDTLHSGMPNAIRVARELQQRGHRLLGVRIDSGDLASLSREARRMLDLESLGYVRIVASNELDEYAIADILARGGRVDIWGVGTNLVTGSGPGGGALGGVYKMVEHNGRPKIKRSQDPGKTTNPGRKRIVRFYGADGCMEADALCEDSEDLSAGELSVVDPDDPGRRKKIHAARMEELLRPIVESGETVCDFPFLDQIRGHCRKQLSLLHESHRRIHNPQEYKVWLTQKLWLQKELLLN